MNCLNFSLIVAINNDSMIGIREYGSDTLPWPMLKEDMNHFRKLTTETKNEVALNAIIVGYNTWKSMQEIYKSNKKRLNIVISRTANSDIATHNEIYIGSFNDALLLAARNPLVENIYVVGGSVIYHEALNNKYLKEIHLTHVKNNYPKDNIVEHTVYFPLSIGQLKIMQSEGLLFPVETEREIYDIGKNIGYSINHYQVSPNFHLVYANTIKNERINKYNNYVIPTDGLEEEYQYLDLVKNICRNGRRENTRNGYTKHIFCCQLRYDLSNGYPLATVKRSYPKAIFEELMWMIRGQTDVSKLREKGVRIWDKNSTKEFLQRANLPYEQDDIGPGYGFQMRYFGAKYIDCKTNYSGQGIDQLQECIDLLNKDPNSRRIIIDLWNAMDTKKMALPPCHAWYNFTVDLYASPKESGSRGKLNCHLMQRSWDVLLGWNTTTAALLTYILANHCNLDPGILVHSATNVHLYESHIESGAVADLLARVPRKSPKLKIINRKSNIEDYCFEDLVIENYYPCPPIIAEMIA